MTEGMPKPMDEQFAAHSGDHPGIAIAEAVVQAAIFQAGGYKGPHPDTRTLKAAGLITDKRRADFQPAVDCDCRAMNLRALVFDRHLDRTGDGRVETLVTRNACSSSFCQAVSPGHDR